MKGISTTLVIIVTAIVILVAALVVLTIFGGGIQPLVDITSARNICLQQAAVTCQASGNTQLPPTWFQPTMRVTGMDQPQSCEQLAQCGTCVLCVGGGQRL